MTMTAPTPVSCRRRNRAVEAEGLAAVQPVVEGAMAEAWLVEVTLAETALTDPAQPMSLDPEPVNPAPAVVNLFSKEVL